MKAYEKRLKRRAAKVQTMREEGEHKAVRKLSDSWSKRIATSTKGFYNQKAARAARKGE